MNMIYPFWMWFEGGIDVYFSSLNSDSTIRVCYGRRSHEIEIESEIYCVASFYNQIENIFETEWGFSSLFTKNENKHRSKGKQSKPKYSKDVYSCWHL